MAKSTGELFTELKEDKNLSGYFRRNSEEFILPLNEYLEKLLAGEDPLLEERQKIAKKIYDLHKDATKKIVARVEEDFKLSEVI